MKTKFYRECIQGGRQTATTKRNLKKSYYRREFDFWEDGQGCRKKKENGIPASYLKGDPGELLLQSPLVCFFPSSLSLFSPLAIPSHTYTNMFTYFSKRESFIRSPLSPFTPVNKGGIEIFCMKTTWKIYNTHTVIVYIIT